MTSDEILNELKGSRTDLARVVRAATRDTSECVTVCPQAVRGWQEREPGIWAKVHAWLASRGTPVVVVDGTRRRGESRT